MPYVICLGIRQRKERMCPKFSLIRLRDLDGLGVVAEGPSLLGYDGLSGQVVLPFRRIVLPSTSGSSSA